MFLCTPFANRCLHSSSAILDGIHPVHIQLIGAGFGIHLITAAVRNKDVNFI